MEERIEERKVGRKKMKEKKVKKKWKKSRLHWFICCRKHHHLYIKLTATVLLGDVTGCHHAFSAHLPTSRALKSRRLAPRAHTKHPFTLFQAAYIISWTWSHTHSRTRRHAFIHLHSFSLSLSLSHTCHQTNVRQWRGVKNSARFLWMRWPATRVCGRTKAAIHTDHRALLSPPLCSNKHSSPA